ncbi:WecB/TagA/CpsF family glycosyltransferase [Labrenzia sp. PHM005]|uniref:WecB/TagA/CpsF family glycosyltransferase n=1 Tax=Labrenzia sp. PHM005 TaxID=2590016 RepID=UPI001AD93E5D|nr:WecB/TagA/CpsF family glycosyltransferase [Labrenzia sp. PHM005]
MMLHKGKFNVLGVSVDALDYAYAVDSVLAAAKENRPFKVTALAVHGVMTGVMDPVHRWRLNGFDLVTPDGQPVRWALNLIHRTNLAKRVYGPDLTLHVCEAAAKDGIPVYFYGSRSEVLEALVSRLQAKFPELKIAGSAPSQFRQVSSDEKEQIAQKIRESGAGIVFVGLGCPRQEVFVHEFAEAIGKPLLAVGAAFDFHAGLKQQAPRWMQDRGLEWFFRLMQEPGRLWRRYLGLNSYFLILLFLQTVGLRRFSDSGSKPAAEVGYA